MKLPGVVAMSLMAFAATALRVEYRWSDDRHEWREAVARLGGCRSTG